MTVVISIAAIRYRIPSKSSSFFFENSPTMTSKAYQVNTLATSASITPLQTHLAMNSRSVLYNRLTKTPTINAASRASRNPIRNPASISILESPELG